MENNFGQVSKNENGYEVKFERILPYNIETVWEAITDPKHLAIWFTDIAMDFKVGGQMTIFFRDENKTPSSAIITKLDRPHIFEYLWEGEQATWELFAEGSSRCKLILTYSKLPTTYAISVPAGWHILLDQLEAVLKGRKEPYPFGGGEETEQERIIKSAYAANIEALFPELKKKS
jgi:uncharacterized protein YndB with AHSA1/START domain